MKENAKRIIEDIIEGLKPATVLKHALGNLKISEKLHLVSVGKAAWDMAKAAKDILGERIVSGVILTKYGYSKGIIEGFRILEASHPIPDKNSVKGAIEILEYLNSLESGVTVLFLLSGGASSVFEIPENGVSLNEIVQITEKMLRMGADIYELNAVRKRLSKVKGGKLARLYRHLNFLEFVISDVIGDRLDVIGSGPLHPDASKPEYALKVAEKYSLPQSVKQLMKQDLSGNPGNVKSMIVANVERACDIAKKSSERFGYKPYIFGCAFEGEARELGKFIGKIAREIITKNRPMEKPCALIFGGETTVTVKGNGEGGRNQEIALSAALEIRGLEGVVVVAFGTDGTDGPTDAAGGIVDGFSIERMKRSGINPKECLEKNDSYSALKASESLIVTGPTGTNVNDVYFVLCR